MESRMNTDPSRYAEEGYFVVRSMVPAAGLPGLREEVLASIEENKASEAYTRPLNQRYLDFAAGLHLKRPAVADLLRSPHFRELNARVLGPDVDLRFTSTVTKHREKSSPVEWHQDSGYDMDPEHLKFSWWIALTDATRENGSGIRKEGRLCLCAERRTALGKSGNRDLAYGPLGNPGGR
jgi:hypothetical protein